MCVQIETWQDDSSREVDLVTRKICLSLSKVQDGLSWPGQTGSECARAAFMGRADEIEWETLLCYC